MEEAEMIKALVYAVVAAVLLTACGGALPTPAPTPGEQNTPLPTSAVRPTEDPRYGHAPDYSWVRGQLQLGSGKESCWYIQYDPAGNDPYGGQLLLIGNMPDIFKSGDFVQVRGQFDTSVGPAAPPCSGTPYRFTGIELLSGAALSGSQATPGPQATPGNAEQSPTPPAEDSRYGHAPDYSWLRGQIVVTGIQGGCTYLVYDPAGKDKYGGRVVPEGDLGDIKNGEFVVVTGGFSDGPHEMCPGTFYRITSIKRQ